VRTPALCVAVLALAACGGSGSGGTLTKARYDAKLSHLCLVAADQVRELHMDNSAAAWRHDGARLVAIDRRFKNALAALKPPPSIASAVASYTEANDRAFQDATDALSVAEGKMSGTTLRATTDQMNIDYLATSGPAREIGATGCYIG
jgi:hypothetical protein